MENVKTRADNDMSRRGEGKRLRENSDSSQKQSIKRANQEVEEKNITAEKFTQIITEALKPIHSILDDIQESQIAAQEEATYFHATTNESKKQEDILQLKLERESKELKQQLQTLEMHSRRNNLRFHGLEENADENDDDVEAAILALLKRHSLPHDPRIIERAHRLGPKIQGKIRPIIVKFNHYKDRQAVWKKLGHSFFTPPHNKIHTREDYPDRMEKERATLQTVGSAIIKSAVNKKQRAPFLSLSANTLIMNKKKYTTDTLHKLNSDVQLSSLYTPMIDTVAAYYSAHSPLSNHYLSTFKVNGERFNCGEQFIITQKARCFNDQEIVTAVSKETNPVKQKALGKSIKNYNHEQWKAKAAEMITPGLVQKFMQCEEAKCKLLKTEQRKIIEANQYDSFLGAGLALHDANIWKPETHKGKNLMGTILEKVRETINDNNTA